MAKNLLKGQIIEHMVLKKHNNIKYIFNYVSIYGEQKLFRIKVALGIDWVCFGNLSEGFLELKNQNLQAVVYKVCRDFISAWVLGISLAKHDCTCILRGKTSIKNTFIFYVLNTFNVSCLISFLSWPSTLSAFSGGYRFVYKLLCSLDILYFPLALRFSIRCRNWPYSVILFIFKGWESKINIYDFKRKWKDNNDDEDRFLTDSVTEN